MSVLQNMRQKERELQTQFDLLSQKISRLRKALAIETDPADKFKLEHQLEEAEAEREQLEQQLTKLQHHLETYNMQATSEISAVEVLPVDSKEQHTHLHNQIVEFLTSLPNIQDKNERRALIFSASLDKALEHQILFEGTTTQFCQLLVNTLASYGTLQDGRHALVAILEAAKQQVGKEKRVYCETLIQKVKTYSPEGTKHIAGPDKSGDQQIDKSEATPETPTQPNREETSVPQHLHQPLKPLQYGLISLIAFGLGGGILWVYLAKANDLLAQGISEKVFYILLLPLGLCAGAFLFGVMRSYATYTGNALGGALELGGPVVVFLLVVIGGFKLVPETTPFPLTVYVRDSQGNIVLKNEGSVILEFGGEPQERKLGEYGDAYFRQIPVRFRNQAINVRLNAEGFELVSSEREYVLKGDSLTVEVKRDDSLATVFGTVRDTEGQPLNDVQIRIGELVTTTQADGRFMLNIPPDKQQKQQTLTAYKEGYKVWEGFVYPATGQEVKIVLTRK